MSEILLTKKCKIVKTEWGREVEKCEGMERLCESDTLHAQTRRNHLTGKMRESLVLKVFGARKPGLVLVYCPFCRRKVDTAL